MAQHDLVIRGGVIVDPWGRHQADIVVDGERITRIAAPGSVVSSRRVIDADGRLVLHGLVDTHCRHRDLGFTTRRTPRPRPGRRSELASTCFIPEERMVEQMSAAKAKGRRVTAEINPWTLFLGNDWDTVERLGSYALSFWVPRNTPIRYAAV